VDRTHRAGGGRDDLIPPVYTDHGVNIRVGRNVFVNQGCRFNDVGGIEIGDDVLLGPNVSLIPRGTRWTRQSVVPESLRLRSGSNATSGSGRPP
jgi:acetyltransferase-like isoleucine patch superfamily enzyme